MAALVIQLSRESEDSQFASHSAPGQLNTIACRGADSQSCAGSHIKTHIVRSKAGLQVAISSSTFREWHDSIACVSGSEQLSVDLEVLPMT